MNKLFDIGSTSLDSGTTLIEASAGTGKTYAIAGMVVRLVAERGMGLGQILVVTFTEAATQELRERVRSRIRDAVVFLEERRPEADSALAAFNQADPEQTAKAVRHLKNSLLSFDEASIFTIHGFCQRMLRENAFETGSLFDVELVTDAEPIWRETAEDFWRQQFYQTDEEIGAIVRALGDQKQLAIGDLVDLLRKISRHPELNILAGEETFDLAECRRRLRETILALREEWKRAGEEVAELLKNTSALSINQKSGYPPAVIEGLVAELSALEDDASLPPSLFGDLHRLSSRQLEKSTLKKKQTPEHVFFELCADLDRLLEAFLRLVRLEFLHQVEEGLGKAKKRRNVITFDDLLARLYASLKGSGGDELAAAIGGRFEAALIDEFQDTDPVQWEIFHRVFGRGNHILFLIGDPKQAIYSFRGADIFTYMAARKKADSHYTLGTNWRSDKVLIEGANRLFSRHPEAFLFPEIVFYDVGAAPEKEVEFDLSGSNLEPPPLRLICVSDEDGGIVTGGAAKERILQMMQREIQRLLSCGATWKGRKLEAGDIAVLTRANRDAESVRERLVQAGIPAVIRTDKSVLQTEESEHLFCLLAAILEPHKNGAVKAALASGLFGYTAEELHRIDQDEGRWEELTEQFQGWQKTWNQHGFMRMFREFFAINRVKVRLLGQRDGERVVTNYQHVAECLHSAEYEKTLTPSTLLRWLREQNERTEGQADSHVIRLEKDDNAVQIVTIHRSKGLEYPVVFCPFNWTGIGGQKKGSDIIFHNPKDGDRLTWDLRPEPDPEHVAAFHREQMAEAVRLLYVAVTRARNRCYLYWAVTKESGDPDKCALAHIFGCGRDGGPDGALAAFESVVDAESAEIHFEAEEGNAAPCRIERSDLPEPAQLRFTRDLPQAPLVTSFSGLTARAHEAIPDRDMLIETTESPLTLDEKSPDLTPSIFNFPKGAKAGNFFHSLLETLDFTRAETLAGLVESHLRTFRFDLDFAPVITDQLKALLQLPLPNGVKLKNVSLLDRLVEAPFYFPLKSAKPAALAEVFQVEHLPGAFSEGVGRLGFSPVEGYMTGFIDLILRHEGRYYVLDWKSNWLGPASANYGQDALRAAMAESYYYLQYHLYALALHRHLAVTLEDYEYERDFGGVFYVFLRGVNAEDPASGIFYDRPALSLIGELERVLMTTQARSPGEMVGGGV